MCFPSAYLPSISNPCGFWIYIFLSIRHRFFLPLTCFGESFRLPQKVSLGGACDMCLSAGVMSQWFLFITSQVSFHSLSGYIFSTVLFLVVAILHLSVIEFCFEVVLSNSFYYFFLVLPHWRCSMSRIHSATSATSTLGSRWKASWPTFLGFRLMWELRPWKFWILSQSPSSSSSGSSTMPVQWTLGSKGRPKRV